MKYQAPLTALFQKWNLEGAYVAGNEYWCRCPFHDEKRAAFSVNLETGKWNCLACHARGQNLTQFVSVMDGVPEKKAEDVLERFGVGTLAELKQEIRTMLLAKIDRPNRNGVDTLSTDEWKRHHMNIPAYLLKRRFTEDILREHRIGFNRATKQVVIPVFENGVCRFVYTRNTWKPRTKAEKAYKYPWGVDKTFYLWGAARRPEFYEGKTVVLTEGALDALWLRQNGYPHAFAILGSFMSYGQVSKLERMNPARIILCFDNDKAGYDCTVTSGKMLMKSGFSHVYYLKYPNKQATDPPKCSKAQLDRMFKRRNSVRPLANEFPTSRRMQHLLRSA